MAWGGAERGGLVGLFQTRRRRGLGPGPAGSDTTRKRGAGPESLLRGKILIASMDKGLDGGGASNSAVQCSAGRGRAGQDGAGAGLKEPVQSRTRPACHHL